MKASALAAGTAVLALSACGGGGYGGSSGGSLYGMGTGTTGYAATALVTNTSLAAYGAAHLDAKLINPWGVAFNPQGFVWVANNGSASSTLYDGNGVAQSLVVTTPAQPTGVVFNGTSGFVVGSGTASGASAFVFATQGGLIAGWSPAANATATITMVDNSAAGASYTGLATTQGATPRLYAADFHDARVDTFDANFAAVNAAGTFVDPNLPAGFAPFGIQAIGGNVYVAYARQDALAHNAVAGAGLGYVDVFDASGALVKRLVSGGALDAPWGMAMAPAGFGTFAGDLLVANFGDGRINAFNPSTGALMGTLSTSTGTPIAVSGLWGIAFGNGINAQPATTLFYAAGPNGGNEGVYGRIDAL